MKAQMEAEAASYGKKPIDMITESNHHHSKTDQAQRMQPFSGPARRLTVVRIAELSIKKSKDYILHLPAELLVDIFSRLPVQDLLRLKSVCKYVYDTLSNPKNVDAFLVARQIAAKVRFLGKVVHLTRRGFINQDNIDLLDALSSFTNRGGLADHDSLVSYSMAAMIVLFKVNLAYVPQHVKDHMLLHYLLQVHVTTHMPDSPMVCLVCKNYTVDTFLQAVLNNCPGLESCGITEHKIVDWYRRLSNPVEKYLDPESDGMHSRGPLLDLVSEVTQPPEHLITHLVWHKAPRDARSDGPGIPVRRGICTMSKLAEKLDVPSLPERTHFREVETTLFIPNNGDCAVPAYFFAYYVKSAWASRLVNGALEGTVDMDNFVQTAIMEELDIY